VSSPNPYDQAASDLFSGRLALGARSSVVSVADRNPDTEAQVQRKAAQLGVPYDSARANPALVNQRTAGQAVDYDNLARQAPATSRFLASTSHAAIAHDDIGVLGQLEMGLRASSDPLVSGLGVAIGGVRRTIADVRHDLRTQGGVKPYLGSLLRTDLSGPLKKGVTDVAIGALGTAESAGELIGNYGANVGDPLTLFAGAGMAGLSKQARRSIDKSVTYQPADTLLGQDIQSGVESIPLSFGALATTIATDGVAPSLALIGAAQYGQSYGQARDQGFSIGRSTAKSAIDAAVEIATEYFPEKFFLKDSHTEASLGKVLLDQIKSEIPSEQVATLLEDYNQWALLDRNRGRSFDDYVHQIVPDAIQTLVATSVGLGAFGGVGAAGRKALRLVNRWARNEGQTAGTNPAQEAAASQYGPLFDALRQIRWSPGEASDARLQAIADEHAQKKPVLEQQYEQATTDLAAAEQALSGIRAAGADSKFIGRNEYGLAIFDESERLQAARAAVREAASAQSFASMALQAHAYVEGHIQARLSGREQAQLEAAARQALTPERILANRKAAAQQAILFAQRQEEISKLAAASKLRERDKDTFQGLVEEMAEGSDSQTVYASPAAITAALSEESHVVAA